MRKFLIIMALFLFYANCMLAQVVKIPVDKTLKRGQELTVLLDTGIDRITIILQNIIDSESVVYRTMFVDGKEKPENEIGPKKYRTVTLSPHIKDESEPIRLDKKELVLNTGGADKILIRIEKGEVNIQIKPNKKRI